MKKNLLFAIFSLFTMRGMALEPSTALQGQLIELSINCQGTPNPVGGHTPIPRSPMPTPSVYIDEQMLFTACLPYDAVLQIVDEDDDVVYTTIIPIGTDSLSLPSSLSGSYELRIIPDGSSFYFYGYVMF